MSGTGRAVIQAPATLNITSDHAVEQHPLIGRRARACRCPAAAATATAHAIRQQRAFAWTAISNTTYRVEFNPTLAPSNWTALPGDVISPSSFASKLDILTPSNRFYWVQIVP